MDWSNDVHCLYRIMLKLHGRIESVEDHKDNTYTVALLYPRRRYISSTQEEIYEETCWTIKLTPRE